MNAAEDIATLSRVVEAEYLEEKAAMWSKEKNIGEASIIRQKV